MVVTALINNIALIVSLSILHGALLRRFSETSRWYPCLSGILFGSVAVIGMLNPLVIIPGLIFDGRSIIISTSGFLGGPVTAAISAVMSLIYRIWLGGPGALVGVSVITWSACVGAGYHFLVRRNPHFSSLPHVLIFGIVVHVGMLLLMILLPSNLRMEVLQKISLPVMVVYPVGTVLICGVLLDQISYRKVDEALRRSEARFRVLSENAPFGVTLLGGDHRFQYINPYFTDLFGYTAAEMPDKQHWFDLAYPDPVYREQIRNIWLADFERVSEVEKIIERTVRVRCQDKSEKEVSIRTVSLDDGRQLAFYEDITERKRLEDHYRQAQRMEAVGQLAGGIAHDFNNLLQAIQGFTELALSELPSGHGAADDMKEVRKAADRAATLVRQLLAFSRRQTMQMKDIDLNQVIIDLAKMLRRVIGEHIELKTSLKPDLKPISADPGQVEQILLNLCVNSRDALPDGGVILIETVEVNLDEEFVKVHPWSRPGDYVVLSVSDDGKGMAPEVQERVFEPFFTTKEVGKGTGLGLATVYGIVRQHEGFIHVYSELEHGTIFRIYLPTAVHSSDSGQSAENTGHQDFIHGKGTILIAEDEILVRDLAARILGNAGYEVLVASDGQEALDLFGLHGNRIDLFLLDMVMPRKSGKQVYDEIRIKKENARFVFSSGYSFGTLDGEHLSESGVVMIQKPYSPPSLLRVIHEALNQPERQA